MTVIDWWLVAGVAFVALLALLSYFLFFPGRTRPIRGLRVLITGCDTGLGHDLALHLSSLSLEVYAGCLTSDAVDALSALKQPALHPLQLDITSDASVHQALTQLTPSLLPHGLDALINNAGIYNSFISELTPMSVYERSLAVNFLGAVRVTVAFLPLLRHASGRVLSISSFLGFSSMWGLSAYSSTKHALEAWHDSIRAELRPFAVQCSLIQPGTMRTPLLSCVSSSYQRLWAEGSEEVKAAYGEETLAVLPRINRVMDWMKMGTGWVVRTVERSLRSERSRSRYVVGWDSWGLWLLRFAPISDHAVDAACAWLVGMPGPSAAWTRRQESEEGIKRFLPTRTASLQK